MFSLYLDKRTDEKPETKRKQTELKAVPEKKVRTEKERCSDHPEGNNDGDDQSVLEALLKRDEDADAVVQILDDYNGKLDFLCIVRLR